MASRSLPCVACAFSSSSRSPFTSPSLACKRPESATKVVRGGCGEPHAQARARVVEAEDARVKGLVTEALRDFAHTRVPRRPSVEGVAQHGGSALREVDANLVGATGLEAALDERRAGEALDDLHVGDRPFAPPQPLTARCEANPFPASSPSY